MANLFPTIFSKTSIVGATFAVIEVEQYNNFVISSCNQLFFEMILLEIRSKTIAFSTSAKKLK